MILLGAIGYFSVTQPAKNTASNITNTTTNGTSSPIQNNIQNNQSSSSNSNLQISAAEAKSIATRYLTSNTDKFPHTAAGTPSLKGGVYYVPVVESSKNGQNAKGTTIAYIRVDQKTGNVIGVEEIYIA